MNSHLIRHCRWLALILILLGGLAMAVGPAQLPDDPDGMLADQAESTEVSRILAERPGEDNGAAVVLFRAETGEQLDMGAVTAKAGELGGPPVPNEDGTAALVMVEIEASSLNDNFDAIEKLRAEAAAGLPEGVSSQVTGPAAITADLSGVFEGANFLLLAVTGVIVAVLLIVTYRSPVLWILPLLVIGVADRVAATVFTWVLDAFGMTWNESTAGILSVLVFGAGTNYALLLISRYRDELHRTDDRFAAMSRAWTPTAKTILASAVTVVLGVACLLLSGTPATRGLGAAAMVGIMVALIFAVFVLPGALVTFGRWIFWPRRPQQNAKVEHRFWNRIGSFVQGQPVKVMFLALVALGVACIGATQMSTGLQQEDQFIDTPESIAAGAELSQAFPGQDATPANVVTDQAAEVTTILEGAGAVVNEAESAAGFTVLNVSGPETGELRDLLADTDALVGGSDAELYDTEEYSAQDRLIIFPLVLAVVLVALVFLLRSLLAPAIMVISVLLSNIAALGLGWWISSGIFGFDTYADTTPLYAFVFLVALGIDYSIFLITRTREESRIHGTRKGVLRALSATGGVITSAGILLAAVFAALGVLPLVALAQVGIVIFIGVLLDTLVVRTLLIPSIVVMLGDRFWWPAKLDPPRTDSEPELVTAGSTRV